MNSKTLCLGALEMLGAASGYEIRKLFEDGPFSHFHPASYGSIYPALGKLAEDGLVTCTEKAQSGRPDKKVYALTEAGRAALVADLHRRPGLDKLRSEYLFTLTFGHLLTPERLTDLLDEYRDLYVDRLDCMRAKDASAMAPGRRFVYGFGLAIYEAAARYIEENRTLLEEETTQ